MDKTCNVIWSESQEGVEGICTNLPLGKEWAINIYELKDKFAAKYAMSLGIEISDVSLKMCKVRNI